MWLLNSWEEQENELVAQQNDEDLLQGFIFKGFLSKSKAKAMYCWVIYPLQSIMEVSGKS